MKYLLSCGFLLMTVVLVIHAAPIFEDDDFDFSLPFVNIEQECTNLGCPKDVTSCSKKTTTSSDKATLITERVCYSSTGSVLKNDTTTENNSNPNSIMNTYEYYGSYSNGGSHGVSISNGNTGTGVSTSGTVETFDKK